MFEHVMRREYGSYFDMIKRSLQPGGISVAYKIFNNPKNDERFVDSILKRKGYIKQGLLKKSETGRPK